MVAVGAAWSVALAVAVISDLAFAAAEARIERRADRTADASPVRADVGWKNVRRGDAVIVRDRTAAAATPEASSEQTGTLERAGTTKPEATMVPGPPRAKPNLEQQGSVDADPLTGLDFQGSAGNTPDGQEAQFQLPPPSPEGGAPAIQLPTRLVYQYGYGSESDVLYREDRDLNERVEDDSLLLVPQLNGHIVYRPTDWLETTLEVIIEREIALREEKVLFLSDGSTEVAPDRRYSLMVDQALVTIKNVIDPFEFSIGRRNFEDNRHFVYDTSMDVALVTLRQGKFQIETSVGREVLVDLDFLKREVTDRINNYIVYADYRGIEDVRVGAYVVYRDDRADREGRPLLFGLRSTGAPTENFSYWTELAILHGNDESSQSYTAHAFDVGATYRFLGLPLNPNVTLGFAFATGDSNPDDNESNEFRQTGLQSNETKFAGISEFKVYGEALDPELSNLKILTAGLGFRPAPNVSVDFVYHRYWADEIADEIRNWGLTALMNQVDGLESTDVGQGFDVVVGIRNLFGVRRLGVDLRAGWFFPGDAFRTNIGDDDDPVIRDADAAVAVVAKIWW